MTDTPRGVSSDCNMALGLACLKEFYLRVLHKEYAWDYVMEMDG